MLDKRLSPAKQTKHGSLHFDINCPAVIQIHTRASKITNLKIPNQGSSPTELIVNKILLPLRAQ